MFVKKLFYASAAILMLALAYHLGALTAIAQTGGTVECVGGDEHFASAVVNHRFYTSDASSPAGYLDQGPLPGAGRAVACGSGSNSGTVVMEDGTVWYLSPSGWSRGGSLPIAIPTPTTQSTWGSLKAKAR